MKKYLFITIIILLTSCKKDFNNQTFEETQKISLEEAKLYFENQNIKKSVLFADWESFENEDNYAFVNIIFQQEKEGKLYFTKSQKEINSEILIEHQHKDEILLININLNTFLENKNIKNNGIELSEFTIIDGGQGALCDCGYPIELIKKSKQITDINGTKNVTYWEFPEYHNCPIGICNRCCLLSEGVVVSSTPNKKKYYDEEIKKKFEEFIAKRRQENLTNNNNYGRGGNSSSNMINYSDYVKYTKNDLYKRDSIYDEIDNQYVCAKDLLKKSVELNNDFGDMLSVVFSTNAKFHITFKDDPLLIDKNIDGTAKVRDFNIRKQSILEIDIKLNPNILKNSTKEYILATMYHEVLHAYFSYEQHNLGSEKFSKKYPEIFIHHTRGIYDGKVYSKSQFLLHDNKPKPNGGGHLNFGAYIPILTTAIRSYNPNMSREVAEALAKVGIIRPSNFFDWEIEIINNEREGKNTVGTKCN